MKNLLIVACALLLTINVNAQSTSKNSAANQSLVKNHEKYNLTNLQSSLKGTYQFKVVNSDEGVLVSYETLQLIESSRKQSESVVLDFNSTTKIVIPSFDEIEANGFEPLTQVIFIK
tara:strand:- start:318 stop:668 length:351 start_codon:yes stop_codon:yes gene_type:complete